MPYSLPTLPYSYDALEPHIDEKTMEIHHSKHHQTYIDKLNSALEKYEEVRATPLEELLKNLSQVPREIRTAVQNHGGGHYNHSLFWHIMSPSGGNAPGGELAHAIDMKFGDFEEFQKVFSDAAVSRFGSGWAWLVASTNKSLEVMSTLNQDTPISQSKVPILGIDVWEHAYYLKYHNKRQDYVAAWWNVVDWQEVERRYNDLK